MENNFGEKWNYHVTPFSSTKQAERIVNTSFSVIAGTQLASYVQQLMASPPADSLSDASEQSLLYLSSSRSYDSDSDLVGTPHCGSITPYMHEPLASESEESSEESIDEGDPGDQQIHDTSWYD